MLLCVDEGELAEVRRAVGEAAYYLSDTLEPDERATLLGEAEAHLEPRQCQASEDRAADALLLLCDATAHPRLSADEADMRGAQLAVAALVAELQHGADTHDAALYVLIRHGDTWWLAGGRTPLSARDSRLTKPERRSSDCLLSRLCIRPAGPPVDRALARMPPGRPRNVATTRPEEDRVRPADRDTPPSLRRS
jgi:hypothetical protein